MTFTPDFKKPPAIRDAKLMKELHIRGVICCLCGKPGTLHHIYPRGQGGDDVRENLLGLCGDGTTGHHGEITEGDLTTRADVGEWILAFRPNAIEYVLGKLGESEGREWLRQRYFIDL